MTHSGKRRLLGSNLENKLMLWADSAQNDVWYDNLLKNLWPCLGNSPFHYHWAESASCGHQKVYLLLPQYRAQFLGHFAFYCIKKSLVLTEIWAFYNSFFWPLSSKNTFAWDCMLMTLLWCHWREMR
jgi:hypothetical protein